MTLEELLDTEGLTDACTDCEFFHEWEEHHPYGMGTATEFLAECRCPRDELCRRLNQEMNHA